MQYYETDSLDATKAAKFREWFDREIGTDREENEGNADGTVYYLCSDLTQAEVLKIRNFEKLL